MGFISPKQLNEDRKLWLTIPHKLHRSLFKFMKTLYPDFKLDGIHCLECEGLKPFEVIVKKDFKVKFCTGYVKDGEEITLLNLTDC